jgi:hypothetical protein
MDQVLVALTKLIAHPGARPFPSPATLEVDLETAPACVADLARAMATNYRNLDIGEFSMYAGTPRTVMTLQEAIEMSDIPLDELEPADRIDPKATLHLGDDGGGMSALGVSWSADGQVSMVVVEIDDPTPENLIQRFSTPAEFLSFLERNGKEVGANVRELLTGGAP